MIVRIMGEGQLDVADSGRVRLEAFDKQLLAALDKGDDQAFRRTLHGLLAAVREVGAPLPDSSLEPSELILPNEDATVEEVRKLLRDGGLISG